MALILLAACLAAAALLPRERAEVNLALLRRRDSDGMPLPPRALARLRGPSGGSVLSPVEDRDLLIASMHFLGGGHTLVIRGRDGSLRLRDWKTGRDRRCWRAASMGHFDLPLPIDLSPDGRTLAKALDAGTIRLSDANTGRELRTLRTAEEPWFLTFSADGEYLVSQALKGSQQWSVRTGEEIKSEGVSFEALDLVLYSPDGRWLVTQQGVVVGQPRHAYLWDTARKQLKYVIKDQGDRLSIHAFSPDGRMLAGTFARPCRNTRKVFETNDLVLWDTTTGRERRRLSSDGHVICGIAFAPDGRTLALGNEKGLIRLWDVPTGELGQGLAGDKEPIHCLAFSADGERLASVGTSGTGYIWDVRERPGRAGATVKLSRPELETLWRELADGDATRSFQAQHALAAAPQSAMEMLQVRLRPVASLAPGRARRLLAELDSESYAVREQATRELERLGDATEVYLRQALERQPSLELRRRAERLLEGLAPDSVPHLRQDRALEVLEWLDTPEARHLLGTLARGVRGAWLTRQAETSLQRLRQQHSDGRRP